MNMTINTKEKSIVIHESVDLKELTKYCKDHNLNDYSVHSDVKTEYWPVYPIQQPIIYNNPYIAYGGTANELIIDLTTN
jgi:hypothetical protein